MLHEQHDLTCGVGESVTIGDDLCVKVLEIHDDHVRLEFSSSRATPSSWEEILYVQPSEAEYELQVH
ncbi:MAG: carbon storage regulator [Planctomycetes bacterium]|nr:carbon storage regulator [Planctomycetota bacterium]